MNEGGTGFNWGSEGEMEEERGGGGVSLREVISGTAGEDLRLVGVFTTWLVGGVLAGARLRLAGLFPVGIIVHPSRFKDST